jgi:hypothetical protein
VEVEVEVEVEEEAGLGVEKWAYQEWAPGMADG